MPKRLIITIVCFHIAAGLFVLLGIAAVLVAVLGSSLAGVFGQFPTGHMAFADGIFVPHLAGIAIGVVTIVVLAFCIAFAVGIEIVVANLNKLKYWAWIAGIVICGLLLLNGLHGNIATLALGGLGLWGLVDPESVAAFKPGQSTQDG